MHFGAAFGTITTVDAALLKVIAALPADERIELMEAIWDGLVANDEAPAITEAQRQELDRRLDAMGRDPGQNLSWDEVRARIRGR